MAIRRLSMRAVTRTANPWIGMGSSVTLQNTGHTGHTGYSRTWNHLRASCRFMCDKLDEREVIQMIEHRIIMPNIMDDVKEGTVEKWLKKEGDAVQAGEAICEITLGPVYLGVEGPEDCIISEILVTPGNNCPVGGPIANYVHTIEELYKVRKAKYVEHKHEQEELDLKQKKEDVEKVSLRKPDTKTLLKEIRHLISKNLIEDGSDVAKHLQSLARKGDPELISVFEASFEGASFNAETFDAKFFLDNAREILKEKQLIS